AYLEHLTRVGLKASSVARRLSALRSFARHLVREGTVRRDPTEHVERPRLGRPLPKTLSPAGAASVVESPDVTTPRGLRDRALRGSHGGRDAPRVAARVATFLRQPSAGGRRRPPLRAGHARPRRHRDDPDLHTSAVGHGPPHVRRVPSASHVMAKRAHAYPQVDPGAAALVDAPVASVPRGARVGEALRLARRRQAVAVSADGRAWILRDDLA